MKAIIFIGLSSLFPLGMVAQSASKSLYEGNKKYHQGQFKEAEEEYKKAYGVKKNKDAQFNLANAEYQQKKYEDASKQYAALASSTKDQK